MKTRSRSTWMRTLGNVSYIFGVALLIAATVVNAMPAPRARAAKVVSVRATEESCNQPAPQQDRHYANHETVYIRGNNWKPNTTVYWKVEGLPGSNTPGMLDSGRAKTDGNGHFCLPVHKVASPPEGGKYKVTVSSTANFKAGTSKRADYQVDGTRTGTPGPRPPTATPKPRTPTSVPVRGAALGGAWSKQSFLFGLGIGLLGLGLVLHTLARSRKDLEP